MMRLARVPTTLGLVLGACGSPDGGGGGSAAASGASSGGSGTAGTSPDAAAGTGATAGAGGVAGRSGDSGSSSSAEACKIQACASVPGCAGCEQWCDSSCTGDGCGYALLCGPDYVAECFAGKSCAVITSQTTLVKDAELYGCLNGVPMNDVCGFEGGSPEACWKCTYQDCAPSLESCDADPECKKWLACITTQNCPTSGEDGTPACYRECDEKHSTAAAFYKAIYSCTCTSCAICNIHQGACDPT